MGQKVLLAGANGFEIKFANAFDPICANCLSNLASQTVHNKRSFVEAAPSPRMTTSGANAHQWNGCWGNGGCVRAANEGKRTLIQYFRPTHG
jgi:hypothetical protein